MTAVEKVRRLKPILRDAGFRLHVSHRRRIASRDRAGQLTVSEAGLMTMHEIRKSPSVVLVPIGGETHVYVTDSDGDVVAAGIAICRPDEMFSRTLGLEIAVGRLLKSSPQLAIALMGEELQLQESGQRLAELRSLTETERS